MVVRLKAYPALAGVILLAGTAAQAQNDDARLSAAAPAPAPVESDAERAQGWNRVSELLGSAVRIQTNGEVGEIEDLVVADGEIVAAVVSFGGILGVGDEIVHVPYSDLRRDGDEFMVASVGAAGDADGVEVDDTAKLRPEPVAPLQIDEELAEIDPRLAEGIAASEQAYGEKLDHESYDNDAEPEANATPSADDR